MTTVELAMYVTLVVLVVLEVLRRFVLMPTLSARLTRLESRVAQAQADASEAREMAEEARR